MELTGYNLTLDALKAIVDGKECWVKETNGRFFVRKIGGYMVVAKSKVKRV